MELALGRRPADIIDVERADPQQLTVALPEAAKTAQAVRQLAMKAYLEARQAADLRHDIASHLKFEDGPFIVGQTVWYWQEDVSKSRVMEERQDCGSRPNSLLLTVPWPVLTLETEL